MFGRRPCPSTVPTFGHTEDHGLTSGALRATIALLDPCSRHVNSPFITLGFPTVTIAPTDAIRTTRDYQLRQQGCGGERSERGGNEKNASVLES